MGKKLKNRKVKAGRFVGNFAGGYEISQCLRKFATLMKFRRAVKIQNPFIFDKACTECSASVFSFFYAFQL